MTHARPNDPEASGKDSCATNAALEPFEGDTPIIKHRRHYRVVFDQFGVPINMVTDFSHALKVVANILKVLELMHDSAWVHRDISVGNIYYFEGRGLLGDYEYAKRIDDATTHRVRTGTLDFMSAEAQNLQYCYPPDIDDDFHSIHQFKSWSNTNPDVPFRHNSLHDLESVWWVLVWILFFNCIKDATENEEEARARQRITAVLFPGFIGLGMRQEFFKRSNKIYKAFQTLVWCRDDELIDSFSVNLAIGAQRLVKAYTAFEAVLWPAYADFLAGTGVQSPSMFYQKYQPEHSATNEFLRQCVEETFVGVSNSSEDYRMAAVKAGHADVIVRKKTKHNPKLGGILEQGEA